MNTSPVAPRDASRVLSEEYLIARSKILDLAATLDRLERSTGSVEDALQMQWIAHGLQLLCDDETDKAKRLQLLMSRPYESDWPVKLAVPLKS